MAGDPGRASTSTADSREFGRRSALPGAYREHVDGGKRTMDVVIKVRGQVVARKTTVYTRGKVSAEHYFLPQLDWSDPLLGS